MPASAPVEPGRRAAISRSVESCSTVYAGTPCVVLRLTDGRTTTIPAGALDALLKDKNKLAAVLTYHVVPGKIMAADVTTSKPATVNGQFEVVYAPPERVLPREVLEAPTPSVEDALGRMTMPVLIFVGKEDEERFDALARLWDGIGGFDNVGFCLDTCHAHAGGNPLETIVDDVLAITGRIDLVHANDSRDEFGSGADRHANFGTGQIDPQLLVAVVGAADAPEASSGASDVLVVELVGVDGGIVNGPDRSSRY